MTDLSGVPLVALSDDTRQLLSTLLNPVKIIPSDDGLCRDWKGLDQLSGVDIPNLSLQSDPTKMILNKLQGKAHGFMIKDLLNLLERLDRWDIIDDTEALMVRDAEVYTKGLANSSTPADPLDNDVDKYILTVDDLYRTEQGLQNQRYNAFLLFADEDADFAYEVDLYLREKCGFKVCIKDRDLIGGVTFEHKAVLTLIYERCNRLVVIVSPSFLRSPANKFFLTFAQSLGIDKRQRKVIPCLYQKCMLPPEITYYFILDYTRTTRFSDFWKKLRDSIKAPTIVGCKGGVIQIEPRIDENDENELTAPTTNGDCSNFNETTGSVLENDTSTLHQPRVFESKIVNNNGQPLRNGSALELKNAYSLTAFIDSQECNSTLSLPNTIERKKRKNLIDKLGIRVKSFMRISEKS